MRRIERSFFFLDKYNKILTMYKTHNPFRAKMVFESEEKRRWKVKFKIGDVWAEVEKLDTTDPDEFDQFKSWIMPKLRRFNDKMNTFLEDEDELKSLNSVILDLDDSSDMDEWNLYWDEFYDWSDDNDVWVEIKENSSVLKKNGEYDVE